MVAAMSTVLVQKSALISIEILHNQWKKQREHWKVHGTSAIESKFYLVSEAIIHTLKDLDAYVGYQNTIVCILMYLLDFRLAVSYIHRESLRIE